MGHFIKVPIEEVQIPKQGYRAMVGKWWLVEDGCVLGFKLYGEKSKERPAPQCNDQKAIIEMALKRKPNQSAVYLDCAFWPAPNDV
jgi:hypothetical protein